MICMALYCKWIEKSNVVGAERAFTCSTLYLSSNDWSLNNLNNVCDGYETLYRTLLKRWHNKMKVCLMLSRKWTVHNNFRKSWVLLVDLNGWNFILCLHLFCIYLHFSNWLKFYFVFTFILHFLHVFYSKYCWFCSRGNRVGLIRILMQWTGDRFKAVVIASNAFCLSFIDSLSIAIWSCPWCSVHVVLFQVSLEPFRIPSGYVRCRCSKDRD